LCLSHIHTSVQFIPKKIETFYCANISADIKSFRIEAVDTVYLAISLLVNTKRKPDDIFIKTKVLPAIFQMIFWVKL
jgi:hypothetical protein